MYIPRIRNDGNRNSDSIINRNHIRERPTVVTLAVLFSLLTVSLLVPVSTSLHQTIARAAVDIDASGDGRAAAFDGEEGIATDGDSFCSITEDIAGGMFTSLFEGIVGDCDDSQISSQFLVDYSYSKNPVKIGEKTYLTITVKDKDTGNPVSSALIKLAIGPPPPTFGVSTALAATVAGTNSVQEVAEDKTIQTMHTDNNGRATFTVQLGPKSDLGLYDTEIEVRKESYQSSFQQTDLRVV